MTITQRMLDSHPDDVADVTLLAAAIDACFECAAACTSCADACLAEEMVVDLVRCISTDLDCADLCTATGRILCRQTTTDSEIIAATLAACITACSTCADDCESHADMHEHCRLCAEVCRRCQEACRELLTSLA